MEKKRLVINTGSTSKKYALYVERVCLFSARIEKKDNTYNLRITAGEEVNEREISLQTYERSFELICNELISKQYISNSSELAYIALRIVSPGSFFNTHAVVDDTYKSRLKENEPYAPLHISPVLNELDVISDIASQTPLFAISDSAFHKALPHMSRINSFSTDDTEKYEVYKSGFHGISLASILRTLDTVAQDRPEKIIIAHLGGGSSITALQNGKSIDTSMGFTPVTGLPMGTRSGDVDVGALLYMQEKKDMSIKEVREYIQTSSGLLGMSQESADIRTLLELEQSGNMNAKLALDYFAYQVKKYIGAYVAALDGIDLLVLTGTISERSPLMRSRILNNLTYLNLRLNTEKNEAAIETNALINEPDSVRIAVMQTREMDQIVFEADALSTAGV